MAQTLKNLLSMQEAWVSSLGQEDPLEKGASSFISFGYIPRSGITESYSNSTLNFVKKKKKRKEKETILFSKWPHHFTRNRFKSQFKELSFPSPLYFLNKTKFLTL